MRTYATKVSDIERSWWVIDASGKTLGRMSTEIALMLRGKKKTIYSPHMDTGDFVIVLNAAKVRVTGKKAQDKIYYHHTNYPGGLKSTTFGKLIEVQPNRAIEHAVRGMLPHNRLGRAMAKRLKVYAGDTHPHQAQTSACKMERS